MSNINAINILHKNFYRMIVPLIVAVVSYLVIILIGDKDKVIAVIKDVPTSVYFILLSLSILGYLLRLFRWMIYMHKLDLHIEIKHHALIYFSGYALTLTPGRVGEAVRSVFLKELGLNYTMGVAACFSERFMDVIVITGLSSLVIYNFPEYQLVAFVFTALILAFFILAKTKLLYFFVNKSQLKPIREHGGNFFESVQGFLDNYMLMKTFPISLLAWLCQGVALYVILISMGYSIDWFLVLGVYGLSLLMGAVSSIPGGVGVTEAGLAVLLSLLGVEPENAAAAAIINRVTTLWFAIFIGAIALIITPRFIKNHKLAIIT